MILQEDKGMKSGIKPDKSSKKIREIGGRGMGYLFENMEKMDI